MGDEEREEIDASEFWWERLKRNKVGLGLGLMGVVAFGLGVKSWWSGQVPESAVEIVMADPSASSRQEGGRAGQGENDELVVDVSGAVERPGVYRLESEARVGEALEKAGGLVEGADLDYVSRQMNLAGKLADGTKVYVPFVGDDLGEGGLVVGGGVVSGVEVVNVNTASLSELDGLWGVGEARARAIIDNRPYGDEGELKSKAGIPSNVVERNKDKISF